MNIDTATRRELENMIVLEDGLYERFDEQKLLSQQYTDSELRAIIRQWITDGDETMH